MRSDNTDCQNAFYTSGTYFISLKKINNTFDTYRAESVRIHAHVILAAAGGLVLQVVFCKVVAVPM